MKLEFPASSFGTGGENMKGRLSGEQFFLWYLPTVILGIGLTFHFVAEPYDSLVAIAYLVSLPVAVIAAIRRSHDLGHSGWFSIIAFIPFFGWYLVFKPGDPLANKYGPPPGSKPT
jgi:uncharacterized membrane protein YhaH (DUF805 family)